MYKRILQIMFSTIFFSTCITPYVLAYDFVFLKGSNGDKAVIELHDNNTTKSGRMDLRFITESKTGKQCRLNGECLFINSSEFICEKNRKEIMHARISQVPMPGGVIVKILKENITQKCPFNKLTGRDLLFIPMK